MGVGAWMVLERILVAYRGLLVKKAGELKGGKGVGDGRRVGGRWGGGGVEGSRRSQRVRDLCGGHYLAIFTTFAACTEGRGRLGRVTWGLWQGLAVQRND